MDKERSEKCLAEGYRRAAVDEARAHHVQLRRPDLMVRAAEVAVALADVALSGEMNHIYAVYRQGCIARHEGFQSYPAWSYCRRLDMARQQAVKDLAAMRA